MSIISKALNTCLNLCLFAPLERRRASFKQALESGEMSREILVSQAQNLLICGNGIFPYADERELGALLKSRLGGGQQQSPRASSAHTRI